MSHPSPPASQLTGTIGALVKRDVTGSDSIRQALQRALESAPDEPTRAGPRPASPARERRVSVAPAADGADSHRGADDAVMQHLTFLGYFVTRRIDEVETRLAALAESIASLTSTIARLPDPTTLRARSAESVPVAAASGHDERPVGPLSARLATRSHRRHGRT